MRGVTLFLSGLAIGLTVQMAVAQSPDTGVRMLNHVAVNVPDVEEAVKYYTEKMGYKEALRTHTMEGRLSMAMMQISKETFLEVTANAQRPLGVWHYALTVDNAKEAAATFRKRGLKVSDPVRSVHRYTPTDTPQTGATLANIDDPYMGRIELIQMSPKQRRAIESWK